MCRTKFLDIAYFLKIEYSFNKGSIKNYQVEGKDPMGVAETSLYIAGIKTKEGYTQKEMAMAAGGN